MPDHLTDDLVGAAVVALGAGRLGNQSLRAVLRKPGPELKISLSAEAEPARGSRGPGGSALALNEHGDSAQDLIVGVNGQTTSGSGKSFKVDFKRHGAASSLHGCDGRECSRRGQQ